ncbi:MAG TPA: sodium:proton antiporter [Chloroflexota bacterium]|nr:sodium:proton antiporter [Chloroflexota bacterium]
MTTSDPNVPAFIGLLMVVAVVAAMVRVVRLPYEVALVAAGLVISLTPNAPQITITPSVILTVFLPVLLFHGAYNLPFPEFRAHLAAIAILALPGVLITAGLVGGILHLLAGLSWSVALLFGAIVAATDPVSVLSIFGQVRAPAALAAIVNGESLFNDGTALVLFTQALAVVEGARVAPFHMAGQIVVVIVGSLALGAVVGLGGARILSRIDDALLETTITFIMAYGGYLLADHLTLSGPLETVTAGILLGTRGENVMCEDTRMQARATWEFLDFLANSLVFLLMGMSVRGVGNLVAEGTVKPWAAVGSAIGAVVVSRLIVVALTNGLLRALRRPLPERWNLVLAWVGLRGAVSLAAVLSLPAGVPDRDLLRILTFGVVLFTLLAQGLTIKPLLHRLDLANEEQR